MSRVLPDSSNAQGTTSCSNLSSTSLSSFNGSPNLEKEEHKRNIKEKHQKSSEELQLSIQEQGITRRDVMHNRSLYYMVFVYWLATIFLFGTLRFPYSYQIFLAQQWELEIFGVQQILGIGELAVIASTLCSPCADLLSLRWVVTISITLSGIFTVLNGIWDVEATLYIFRFLMMFFLFVKDYAFYDLMITLYFNVEKEEARVQELVEQVMDLEEDGSSTASVPDFVTIGDHTVTTGDSITSAHPKRPKSSFFSSMIFGEDRTDEIKVVQRMVDQAKENDEESSFGGEKISIVQKGSSLSLEDHPVDVNDSLPEVRCTWFRKFERNASVVTVTSVTQSPWSISIIIVVPIVGVIYNGASWHIPFYITGSLSALCGVLFYFTVPNDANDKKNAILMGESKVPYCINVYNEIIRRPLAWSFLLSTLVTGYTQNMLIGYFSIWLGDLYGMSPARIGTFSLLIGFGEFAGIIVNFLIGWQGSILYINTFKGMYVADAISFVSIFVFAFTHLLKNEVSFCVSLAMIFIATLAIEWLIAMYVGQTGFMVAKSVRSLYFALTWLFLFSGRMFGILSQTAMFANLGTEVSFIIVACIQIALIGLHYFTSFTCIHASDVAKYMKN